MFATPLVSRRVTLRSGRKGTGVIKITMPPYWVEIPISEARELVDRVHDLVEKHEAQEAIRRDAEARRGIGSGFFSGGEIAQIPEGDFDADRE